jgi:hypothetical protein
MHLSDVLGIQEAIQRTFVDVLVVDGIMFATWLFCS